MNPYDIIIRPVITEKSMLATSERKYTFKVASGANKIEIKKAIEAVFPGTKVEKVTTMNVNGKVRRHGISVGRTASWKKAIVKLTPDSKTIEIFEGLM